MSRRGLASAGLLAGFVLVALLVAYGLTLPLDQAVLRALRVAGRPGTADLPDWMVRAVLRLTSLGGGGVRAVLALAGAVALLATRCGRVAAALLSGWAGESLLVEALKALIGRPRPDLAWRLAAARETSFPSGHAAGAMLLYPLLGLFLGQLLGGRAGRLGVVAGVALGLVVGLTRIMLGVHWATDVLAGWLLGGAIAVYAAGVISRRDDGGSTAPA